MGRPTVYDQRVTTAIRLDADLHRRIKEEASARGVSANRLITALIAEGLERLVPVDEFTLVRRHDERPQRVYF